MIDTLLKFGLLPDFAIRMGIRHLLAQRLRDEAQPTEEALQSYLENYAADLRTRQIAEQTQAANEQHYEVPAEFYKLCLGERLKYSGCLYPRGDESLDEAELANYLQTNQRAAAYLDVFDKEPYSGPLAELSNIVLTAHLGSYAREARLQMETQAAENLIRLLCESPA